jgi:hypothetical protein
MENGESKFPHPEQHTVLIVVLREKSNGMLFIENQSSHPLCTTY